MAQIDILEALKGSRLGGGLDASQLATLAPRIAVREMRAGDVLVAQDTSDNRLYVLIRGTLAVMRNAGTPDALKLFTLSPGDLVGELSFLDSTPHYASLVAEGAVLALGLERERLEELLDTDPRLVYQVMRNIMRTTHQIQRRLSMQSVELTNYIYKQHGRY